MGYLFEISYITEGSGVKTEKVPVFSRLPVYQKILDMQGEVISETCNGHNLTMIEDLAITVFVNKHLGEPGLKVVGCREVHGLPSFETEFDELFV